MPPSDSEAPQSQNYGFECQSFGRFYGQGKELGVNAYLADDNLRVLDLRVRGLEVGDVFLEIGL